MTDAPQFLLPSATEAPRPASDPVADDPGYVPGVQYDRWGRYLLPEPGADPASLIPYTRMTTLSGMLTSQDGLRIWSEREIVRGIGRRADLRALAASDPESKATQDEVRETAKVVAGVGASASWGRALHRAVENLTDPSRTSTFAPDPHEQFGRDVIAAMECLSINGIRVRAVETLVCNPMLGYAGRLDALWEVTLSDGRVVLRVGDVKTGDKLERPEKRQPIGCQLAGYANASHVYDPATRTFGPMPEGLDREVGYVLSVREGRAQLYEIDLTAGRTDLLLAVKLHRRRKASTDMLPVGDAVVIEDPATQQLRDALRPELTTPVVPTADVTASQAWAAGAERFEAIRADGVDSPEVATFALPDIPDAAAEHAVDEVPPGVVVEPEVGPSGRKRRACSKCRRPGHTAKNCPGAPADAAPSLTAGAASAGARPVSVTTMLDLALICAGHPGAGWVVPAWSSRPDITVCGECGLPSTPTLERVRGERAGITSLAQPVAMDGSAVADAPPPWLAPASAPSLADQVRACRSQEELGQLWSAHQSAWSEELTALAVTVAPGLPRLSS